eukprot:TRINITY_DN10945_c0_g5_i1.p1 TRINITY_DN10945_c0_g5~~TRINITY_DN10945_c0_g5_i1.p1  ORF type:complete len:243 (-),score=48.95 TRINITY_DN10945_c0_g5_i1:35-763(-)
MESDPDFLHKLHLSGLGKRWVVGNSIQDDLHLPPQDHLQHFSEPPVTLVPKEKRIHGKGSSSAVTIQILELLTRFTEMRTESYKIKPDRYTYRLMMRIFAKMNNPEISEFIFSRLKIMGLADISEYKRMFWVYQICDQPESAISLFELMLREGPTPDFSVYTYMLKFYTLVGDEDKFSEILTKLPEDDTASVNILLLKSIRSKEEGEVKRLLMRFRKMNHWPSEGIYNTVMDMYALKKLRNE